MFASIVFVGINIINIIIFIISELTKKDKIYDIYTMFMSIAFITTYIQGNYLAGSLPTLDGSPIEWNSYNMQGIISMILLIIVAIINIVIYKKFNKSYKKITTFTSLAVFAMLSVSLISILATNTQIYTQKGKYMPTVENLNKLSENKNFLILLTDMMDSKTFDKVLEKNEMKDLLKDFTYYPDTLSAYPFTRESIPYVLSGKWYEAETNFGEYYNIAMDNSKLLDELRKRDYELNLYEQELCWNNDNSLEINNIKAVNSKMDKFCFFKQEAKYILFKYLPFYLKKYSRVESLDYTLCMNNDETDIPIFESDNKIAYDALGKISLQKENYFQFVHIDGGHYLWDMNKNFEKIENGTYEDKIESALTYIEKYFKRIKDSGQYDNSVIILLADHGNNGYDPVGRQNPILYIKGFNEHHEKMVVSDKRVSYVDLNDSIYKDLLDGKQSTELLQNIEDNRIRRLLWYKDYDDIYEQTLDGYAWETDKLVPTGNRYKR